MPKPLPTSIRTVALTLSPLAVLLLLAVWSLIAPHSHSTDEQAPVQQDAGQPAVLHTPIDPVLLVSHTARVVLSADLQRLRASSAMGSWLSQSAPSAPCELQLLSQTQKIVGFSTDRTLQDLTLLLTTTATVETVAQCLAHRGEHLESRPETYRGQPLTLVASHRPSGLLPSSDARAVSAVGRGLLVVGSTAMVRTVLDRALSQPSTPALNETLRALEQTLAPSYAIAILAALATEDSARARYPLEAVSLSLQINDGVRLKAFVGCGDFDGPRLVADALTQTRGQLLQELRFAAFTRSLQSATIEREAASVSVNARMSEDDLRTVLLLLREWITNDTLPTLGSSSGGASGDAGAPTGDATRD